MPPRAISSRSSYSPRKRGNLPGERDGVGPAAVNEASATVPRSPPRRLRRHCHHAASPTGTSRLSVTASVAASVGARRGVPGGSWWEPECARSPSGDDSRDLREFTWHRVIDSAESCLRETTISQPRNVARGGRRNLEPGTTRADTRTLASVTDHESSIKRMWWKGDLPPENWSSRNGSLRVE